MGDKAKLFNTKMPVDFVIFDYNPETLSIQGGCTITKRGNTSAASGKTPVGGAPAGFRNQYNGSRPAQVAIKALLDAGSDTCPSPIELKRRAEMLFSWCHPGGGGILGAAVSALTGGGADPIAAMPPLVTFQWGAPRLGFMIAGYLTSVTVNYVLFDELGSPLRAEVSLTMQEEADLGSTMLTNPTSGGVGGHTSHMLSDGETLQTVAQHYYGTPNLWRAVARANRVDDPFRLAPGQPLFLPARAELAEFEFEA